MSDSLRLSCSVEVPLRFTKATSCATRGSLLGNNDQSATNAFPGVTWHNVELVHLIVLDHEEADDGTTLVGHPDLQTGKDDIPEPRVHFVGGVHWRRYVTRSLRCFVCIDMKRSVTHHSRPGRFEARAVVLVLAMVGLAAGCADDGEPALVDPVSEPTMAPDAGLAVTDPVSEEMSVVLDYSPTISDVGALLYLASHPDVDLLAVTLPERGESDCDLGVRHTLSLLAIAGQLDVPVGCGVEPPLVGDRDWPDEFRQYSNLLAGVELPVVTSGPPVDGAELLADTLRSADRPVTIVAVGPLTNLGVVFRDHPDLVGHVERVVIMGGAVDVPGNVEAAPTAEWNLYIDPQAARLVLASGVDVLFVPLDATNDVPWTDALVAQLALLESAVGKSERQVVASRGFTDGIYLWDELAAVATLQPEMLQIERRTIVVDDDGATLDAPSGASVDVAVGADADAVTREFFRTLNGGVLPTIPDGSPEEHAYFDQLEAGLDEFASAGEAIYAETAGDAHAEADRFIVTVAEALEQLASVIDGVDPPAPLAADHAQLSVAINHIVDQMGALRAAVASAEGDHPFALISAGIKETEVEQNFDDLDAACASIAKYLTLRAGSLSCPSLGGDG